MTLWMTPVSGPHRALLRPVWLTSPSTWAMTTGPVEHYGANAAPQPFVGPGPTEQPQFKTSRAAPSLGGPSALTPLSVVSTLSPSASGPTMGPPPGSQEPGTRKSSTQGPGALSK